MPEGMKSVQFYSRLAVMVREYGAPAEALAGLKRVEKRVETDVKVSPEDRVQIQKLLENERKAIQKDERRARTQQEEND